MKRDAVAEGWVVAQFLQRLGLAQQKLSEYTLALKLDFDFAEESTLHHVINIDLAAPGIPRLWLLHLIVTPEPGAMCDVNELQFKVAVEAVSGGFVVEGGVEFHPAVTQQEAVTEVSIVRSERSGVLPLEVALSWVDRLVDDICEMSDLPIQLGLAERP